MIPSSFIPSHFLFADYSIMARVFLYHLCAPLTIPLVCAFEGQTLAKNMCLIPSAANRSNMARHTSNLIVLAQAVCGFAFLSLWLAFSFNSEVPFVFIFVPAAYYIIHKLCVGLKYGFMGSKMFEYLKVHEVDSKDLRSIDICNWWSMDREQIEHHIRLAAHEHGLNLEESVFFIPASSLVITTPRSNPVAMGIYRTSELSMSAPGSSDLYKSTTVHPGKQQISTLDVAVEIMLNSTNSVSLLNYLGRSKSVFFGLLQALTPVLVVTILAAMKRGEPPGLTDMMLVGGHDMVEHDRHGDMNGRQPSVFLIQMVLATILTLVHRSPLLLRSLLADHYTFL
jgi:hypothetical protein